MKKSSRFNSILERSTNKLWGAHFRVPQNIAKRYSIGTDRRVFCVINGEIEFQCALLHGGKGDFVITVNKKLREALHLKFGAEVDVQIWKDETEYGLPVPEEFAELLKQDGEGARYFQALTPGRRRTLLYLVGNVRTPEMRAFRAIAILNHLKANKGALKYPQLSRSLKDPRRKRD